MCQLFQNKLQNINVNKLLIIFLELDMSADRKIAIEAAVVRIMKAKKKQTY